MEWSDIGLQTELVLKNLLMVLTPSLWMCIWNLDDAMLGGIVTTEEDQDIISKEFSFLWFCEVDVLEDWYDRN